MNSRTFLVMTSQLDRMQIGNKDSGQQYEQDGDAVHTELVADAVFGEPRDVLDELEAGVTGVEFNPQYERQCEHDQAGP